MSDQAKAGFGKIDNVQFRPMWGTVQAVYETNGRKAMAVEIDGHKGQPVHIACAQDNLYVQLDSKRQEPAIFEEGKRVWVSWDSLRSTQLRDQNGDIKGHHNLLTVHPHDREISRDPKAVPA